MAVFNNNWYNSHASRRYPLDDSATGTGDDGTRLQDDVITDLQLRWPTLAGQFAYVAGITVTPTLVTVVILAADTVDSASQPVPLASVTLAQPVVANKHYALDALYPGAGGFIAFGDPTEPFAIRFATPQQGLLNPKSAHSYDALPIPSMRKAGRVDGLTGVVRLIAGKDIEIVKGEVTYDGIDRDAIIMRLVTPTKTDNVLSEYIGPCGSRPESRNCAREAIETISGVGPDCNGNIDIIFRGMAAAPYQDCGAGVTLDQPLGIDDVCPVTPVFRGRDTCIPDSSVSDSSASAGSDSAGSTSSDSLPSESMADCEPLPFTELFTDDIHPSWVIARGTYAQNPTYLSLGDTTQRQVLLWEDCAIDTALNKQVVARVQLTNQLGQVNGGIVLNYRVVDPLSNPHIEYFQLQINRVTNLVELLRFNGTGFVVENAVTPPFPFSLNDWYVLTATMTPSGGNVAISVLVTNDSNMSWGSVSFTVVTSRFGDGIGGYHGIGNNRSVSNYNFWMVDNA